MHPEGTAVRDALLASLPNRPYCADNPKHGLLVRGRNVALTFKHIQLNGPTVHRWLPFDVDRPGSYFAADDGNLPPPNIITVNRKNKRGHLIYGLREPVHTYDCARPKPMTFLAAVERGLRRRLDADAGYSGLITKNPLHEHWDVYWLAPELYDLGELDGWLFEADKRKPPSRELSGLGRNCDTFDEVRQFAYREVLRFRHDGGSEADFRGRLQSVASDINKGYATPLPLSEVRAIAKSVSKWTWRRFSPERFAEIQSARASEIANRRRVLIASLGAVEAGTHGTGEATPGPRKAPRRTEKRPMKAKELAALLAPAAKSGRCSVQTARAYWSVSRAEYERNSISRGQPWKAAGISQATWYRRQKAQREAEGAE